METRESIISSLKLQYESNLKAIKRDRVSNPLYKDIPPHITEHLDKVIEIVEKHLNFRISQLENDHKAQERLLDQISEASFKPGKMNEKMLLMSEYEEALLHYEKRIDDTTRLITLLDNPFFGYIEVAGEGKSRKSSHFIGKYSLVDQDSKQMISDWRSKVGEFFYSEIKDPLVKLRFTFRGGVLSSVVDLNQDKYSILEVFSKDLESRRAGTFKDIISTIQEDQDKVIRDDPATIYVIQGCAGSGKTSIAVHKLSHHIFNKQIDPSKTLYITPNKLFSDYLSDVQTSLGLEEVQFKTFLEWASEILFNKTDLFSEDLSVSYKLQVGDSADEEFQLIDEEDATEFVEEFVQEEIINYLDEMRDELEQYYRKEIPETVREIIEVDQLIKIVENGSEVINFIPEIYAVIKKFPFEDREHLEKFIELTFSFEYFSLYKKYLASIGLKNQFDVSKPEKNDDDKYFNSEVSYSKSDLMNLLLFRKLTHGMRDVGHRTLYIDEVQNYSDDQINTLLSFSEKREVMVLGDIHQRTEADGQEDLKDLVTLLSDKFPDQEIKFEIIDKCYRTTKAIMEYSYKPFAESLNETYRGAVFFRDGVKPRIVKKGFEPSLLTGVAKMAKKENYSTIAVIGDDQSVGGAFDTMKQKEVSGFLLRERGDTDYQKGVYFLTNAEIKGLEFDVVIYLRDLDEMLAKGDWTKAADDHIALSRALHRLVVVDGSR